MGNSSGSGVGGTLTMEHPKQQSKGEDGVAELNESIKSLSLKGKKLFANGISAGEENGPDLSPKDPSPPSSDGSKRTREQQLMGRTSTRSFHKAIRNYPDSSTQQPENNGLASLNNNSESKDDEDNDEDPEIWGAEDDDDSSGDDVSAGTGPGRNGKSKSRVARGAWTQEQDDALRGAVERHEGKHWKLIAREVPGNRTHIQCLQRWSKVLKPGLIKGPWTDEEDDLLRTYVPYEQKGNWVAVAEHVPGRTAKQCRERWSLCLDPNIRKDPWTPEEDNLLLALHEQYGNAWAQIAKHLPGRTENATKSRFKSIERRKDRAWTPSEDATIIRAKAEERKWSEIVAMLPKHNRTKHAIKTRWKELIEGDPSLKRFDTGISSGSDSYSSFSQVQPVPSESSPPNSHSQGDVYNMMGVEELDENAAAASPSPKVLAHTLSSDKLMNLKVQRNESFEEWLAREAGRVGSVPNMMVSNGAYNGGSGGPSPAPIMGGGIGGYGMFQRDNSFGLAVPPFEWTDEDLQDLELV